MANGKHFLSRKRSSPVVGSNSSKKLHIKKSHDHRCRKKTSVDDLAEQGIFIGRELGEGSYCKVKAATFRNREVAVKIIARDQLSIDFESRFLPREIDILSKVSHPNIVTVYKIYSYPRRVFIFMELIERGDLLNVVRNRGRLLESETRRYFRQMVSAIYYLHTLNIAHRDLKCENIMITEDDEIKIVDFGFCRSTVNKLGRRQLSRTFCGSTAYAAPEVLQGIPYNPMMYDVWSMGCVLFIMVTGTMPFDDGNVRKMVTCQLKRQFRFPTTFTVNKEIKKIICHMLEPDVTRRATLKQVSRYNWIKVDAEDTFPEEADGRRKTNNLLNSNFNTENSASTSTQT